MNQSVWEQVDEKKFGRDRCGRPVSHCVYCCVTQCVYVSHCLYCYVAQCAVVQWTLLCDVTLWSGATVVVTSSSWFSHKGG